MQSMLLANQGSGMMLTLVYLVVIVAFFYFFMIRPQKKEQQKKQALLESLEIGDNVLTTAGFYGEVIDIEDDTVIVQFGGNRNCRIPMQKSAIIQVEKPADAMADPTDTQ